MVLYTSSNILEVPMWTIGKYKANLQSGYGSQQSLSPVSIPSFSRLTNASIFGTIIVAVLAIFMVAALVAPVANLTTGITISHTGGPAVNANISQTPGLSPVLQLYPLFFIFIGLLYVAKVASEETRGI